MLVKLWIAYMLPWLVSFFEFLIQLTITYINKAEIYRNACRNLMGIKKEPIGSFRNLYNDVIYLPYNPS